MKIVGGLFDMTGKKGMKKYSREVKQEAVRLYLEEGRTQRQIAEELGVSSQKRVKIWVSQYRKEGNKAFTKPIGRRRKIESEKSYIEQLEMENALLKKYHALLRGNQLARRNIGSFIITEEHTR